jgi:hypothetical protein
MWNIMLVAEYGNEEMYVERNNFYLIMSKTALLVEEIFSLQIPFQTFFPHIIM